MRIHKALIITVMSTLLVSFAANATERPTRAPNQQKTAAHVASPARKKAPVVVKPRLTYSQGRKLCLKRNKKLVGAALDKCVHHVRGLDI